MSSVDQAMSMNYDWALSKLIVAKTCNDDVYLHVDLEFIDDHHFRELSEDFG